MASDQAYALATRICDLLAGMGVTLKNSHAMAIAKVVDPKFKIKSPRARALASNVSTVVVAVMKHPAWEVFDEGDKRDMIREAVGYVLSSLCDDAVLLRDPWVERELRRLLRQRMARALAHRPNDEQGAAVVASPKGPKPELEEKP